MLFAKNGRKKQQIFSDLLLACRCDGDGRKSASVTIRQKEVNLWEMGLSADRIQSALNKWTVDTLPGDYYRFNYLDDPDLKLILDAFGIKIPAKLYRRADLRSIKSDIKI